jgi:sortase (surface protein transpeptidase)
MYYYLAAIIIIIITIFLIYKFYSKIDNFIKKNFMHSQNVMEIKSEMKTIDSKMESSKKDENKPYQIQIVLDKVNEILYIPVDFLYKLGISYAVPLFYTFLHFKDIDPLGRHL